MAFFVGSTQLEAGSPGSLHLGSLRFSVQGPAEAVSVDARSFRPVPAPEYESLSAACTASEDGATLDCAVNGLDLYITRPPEYAIPITKRLADGTTATETAQLRLQLDESAPTVSSLTTNFCQAPPCYVRPGPNSVKATIQNSGSPLGLYPIVLGIESLQSFAACEENLCTAQVELGSCTHGNFASACLSDGRNNAGAPIQAKCESVKCDAVPPEIVGEVELLSSPGNLRYFQAGQTVVAKATANEADSRAFITVDLTALGGGLTTTACTPKSGEPTVYTCAGTGRLGSQPMTGTAKVTVHDAAGNGATRDIAVEVLQAAQAGRQNWQVSSPDQFSISPASVNAAHLKYISPRVFVEVPLTANFPGIVLLGGSLTCQNTVFKAHSAEASGTRVLLALDLQKQGREPDGASLESDCEIRLATQEGTTLYAGDSDRHPVHIAVPLHRSPHFSEAIEEVKRRAERDIDRNQDGWRKWTSWALRIQMACRITKGLSAGDSALSIISAEIGGLPYPFDQFAQPTNEGGQAAGNTAQGLWESIGPYCHMFICDGSANPMFDAIGGDPYAKAIQGLPHIDTLMRLAAYPDGDYRQLSSYQNSIVGSFFSGCIPNLMLAIQKYRAIDCEYVTCLKRDVELGGFPTGQCSDLRRYMSCKYFMGEATSAMPFVNIYKEISQKYLQILRNPTSILSFGLAWACDGLRAGAQVPGGQLAWAVCRIPRAAASVAKMTDLIRRYKQGQVLIGDARLAQVNAPCKFLQDATNNPQRRWTTSDGLLPDYHDEARDVYCKADRCWKGDWAVDKKGHLLYRKDGQFVKVNEKDLNAIADGKSITDPKNPLFTMTQDQAREVLDPATGVKKTIETTRNLYFQINLDTLTSLPGFEPVRDAIAERNGLQQDLERTERMIKDAQPGPGRTALEATRDEIKGKLADAQKRVERELKNAKWYAEQAAFYDHGWTTYRTAMDFALATSYIKYKEGTFFSDWGKWVDDYLAKTFSVENWESKLCLRQFDRDAGTGFVSTSARPAAHIEAEGTRTVDENGQPVNSYFVSGFVQPKRNDAVYSIYLADPGRYLFEHRVGGSTTTEYRGRSSFPGTQTLTVQHPTEFQKVCIEFQDSVREVFDFGRDLDGNALCTPVRWAG